MKMPNMCPFEKWHIQNTSNEGIWAKKISNSMQGIKSAFSQKDTYLAFSFLFPSVLLSCQYHLKAKFRMYFAQPSFTFSNAVECFHFLYYLICVPINIFLQRNF